MNFNVFQTISHANLDVLLDGDKELALLDVREIGAFSDEHILLAVNAPYSSLEWRVPSLLPNKRVPIVLIDDGDGNLALRSAHKLRQWGYRDVTILDGGLHSYKASGRKPVSGLFVPNKAFGEYVEKICHTPSISARELKTWMKQGKAFSFFDIRPYSEYTEFTVPGTVNCPGFDIATRIEDLAPDTTTPVVLTCAGRTRSIIATQTLRDMGVKNPVVCLENGTAGWYLEGNDFERHACREAEQPTPRSLEEAVRASKRLASQHGVEEISWEDWQAISQDERRTTYLFDVRSPAEFLAGHPAGASSAPGGQLIQSTESYVGVRGAILALVDDNLIRARMTAVWLARMRSHKAYVISPGINGRELKIEKSAEGQEIYATSLPEGTRKIGLKDAAELINPGLAVVLDFSTCLNYKKNHISGSWFAVRSRIDECLRWIPPELPVLVYALTPGRASFCAADVAQALASAGAQRDVFACDFTVADWLAKGLPVSSGYERLTTRPDDAWYSPYDQENMIKGMHDYLHWEIGLLDSFDGPVRLPFLRKT